MIMRSILVFTTIAAFASTALGRALPGYSDLSPRALSVVGRNQKCGANVAKCSTGLCCSASGHCGSGENWCDTGCQSTYGTCYGTNSTVVAQQNDRCGPGYGICDITVNLCCSGAGYCGPLSTDGNVSDYCGNGCQTGYGLCGVTGHLSSIRKLGESCGQGVGICGDNSCCSTNGTCGYDDAHCSVDLCQDAFGRCNNGTQEDFYYDCTAVDRSFAYTFDDGPRVNYTDELLDYLDTVNVKVTFFLNGHNQITYDGPHPGMYGMNKTILRAYNAGHQLCIHGWAHIDANDVSGENTTYEFTKTMRAFAEILGVVPTCGRFPYGDYTDEALRVAYGLGLTMFEWNLDTMDWENNPAVGELTAITSAALNPATQSGFILLDHDVQPNTADFVAPYYPPLAKLGIDYLLSKNYTMVKVNECAGSGPMYRTPRPSDYVCGPTGCY